MEDEKESLSCIFKVAYPDDRIHLRQWVETFHDFKESHVRVSKKTRTIHIRAKFGIAEDPKLLALVVLQTRAHCRFYCQPDAYEFWIDNNKWLETLKHVRKSNMAHSLTCLSPGQLQISTEILQDSNKKKKLSAHPILLPISTTSQDGQSAFVVAPSFRTQLLDIHQPYSYVVLPTKQLKSICLHLGPIKSLDDEHPNLFHKVCLQLTPEVLTISPNKNYRGDAKIGIYAHNEEGKDRVLIHFVTGHPSSFCQTHFLYSLYLFCRNQHPVSDYLTLAFAPGKTLVMHAEAEGKAYKLFHLFPCDDDEECLQD